MFESKYSVRHGITQDSLHAEDGNISLILVMMILIGIITLRLNDVRLLVNSRTHSSKIICSFVRVEII